jgi:hypothetical protein
MGKVFTVLAKPLPRQSCLGSRGHILPRRPCDVSLNKNHATELIAHKRSGIFVLSLVRELILVDDLGAIGKDDNTLRNRILSASKPLQKLHFASPALISMTGDLSRGMGIIEERLRELDTKLILGMRQLRTLHFHGFIHPRKSTAKCSPDEQLLRKVKKVGESIQARLRKQGREVEVQLDLHIVEELVRVL